MDNNISSQHSEDCIFEDPSNFENNTATEENSDASEIEFDDENDVIEMEFIYKMMSQFQFTQIITNTAVVI